MIQSIRKIATILVLIASTIILGNCSENVKKAKETVDRQAENTFNQNSLVDSQSIKIHYQLIDVQRFFEKPLEQSSMDEFKQMNLKMDKDYIYLTSAGNQAYSPYQLQTISAQKYLGKGSLYDYYTNSLKNKYDIASDTEITYIQIDSKTPLPASFKPFFYKNYSIITDRYIFLYNSDDYLLVFEKQAKADLSTLYKSLNSTSLPLNFDFDFILEKPNFKKINDSYENALNLNYLTDYSGIVLPNIKNIKVMLVSASQESGENNMYLYSLSEDYKIIEKFDLSYIEGETDSGEGIGRQIDCITPAYVIETTAMTESGKEIKKYSINDSGRFIEIK